MTIEKYVVSVANSLKRGRPKRSTVASVKRFLDEGESYADAVIKTAWLNKYRKMPLAPQVQKLRMMLDNVEQPSWLEREDVQEPEVVSIKVEVLLSNGHTVKYQI